MQPIKTYDMKDKETNGKQEEKLKDLPYVKTWVEQSKDGKYLLFKRLETSIFSEKYMQKVYEPKQQ